MKATIKPTCFGHLLIQLLTTIREQGDLRPQRE